MKIQTEAALRVNFCLFFSANRTLSITFTPLFRSDSAADIGVVFAVSENVISAISRKDIRRTLRKLFIKTSWFT